MTAGVKGKIFRGVIRGIRRSADMLPEVGGFAAGSVLPLLGSGTKGVTRGRKYMGAGKISSEY
jgi:hypothetical protein